MVQKINDVFQNAVYTDGSFVAKLMELNVRYNWKLNIKSTDSLIVALNKLALLSSPELISNIIIQLRNIGLPLEDDATIDDVFDLFDIDKAYVKDICELNEILDWDLPINELQDWETVSLNLRLLIKNNLDLIGTKLGSIGLPLTSTSTFQDIMDLTSFAGDFISDIVTANVANEWGLNISGDSTWVEILAALGMISNNNLESIVLKLRSLGYPLEITATKEDILTLEALSVDEVFVKDIVEINSLKKWNLNIGNNSTWDETYNALKTIENIDIAEIVTKLRDIGLPLTTDSTLEDILALPSVEAGYVSQINDRNENLNWGLPLNRDMSWNEVLSVLDWISNISLKLMVSSELSTLLPNVKTTIMSHTSSQKVTLINYLHIQENATVLNTNNNNESTSFIYRTTYEHTIT